MGGLPENIEEYILTWCDWVSRTQMRAISHGWKMSVERIIYPRSWEGAILSLLPLRRCIECGNIHKLKNCYNCDVCSPLRFGWVGYKCRDLQVCYSCNSVLCSVHTVLTCSSCCRTVCQRCFVVRGWQCLDCAEYNPTIEL